ncbi:hypothetical protein SUGI_1228340 [Cryptomeria japonica]|uniref:Uncharacterized protein n=1 Tax=Cryptomeria japonica TaxID=3369 RepID=A0AAD3NMZ9_CRYJA|nr:hypothetical protein SUGI_1228340 [Cryptomeria japonica]
MVPCRWSFPRCPARNVRSRRWSGESIGTTLHRQWHTTLDLTGRPEPFGMGDRCGGRPLTGSLSGDGGPAVGHKQPRPRALLSIGPLLSIVRTTRPINDLSRLWG